jgi:hypothetical protein
MNFNSKKYENILDNVHHTLSFISPIDPLLPPYEIQCIRQSNHCLQWLYETHLKGKFSHQEIESVLGIVKGVLIPHLQSLQDPDSLSYVDLYGMLTKVLSKFTKL